ncbi:hypothetical protein E1286_05185 [Nonomuraea terrae]|uniref:Head-tail adaptor protein n=1 Tax=Nonomuraea terrae TaxID=2530383 RepID=A0A4R4Z8S5_9ACTN|nr:hypothetical protein [Nonomuraea terrae]TDD54585.1 hypothetical protein E1286_05185 [Nonomuraea terrae]
MRRVESGRDAHGNPVYTQTRTAVSGCSVQPLTTNEQLAAGAQVQGRWRLFGPAGLNLDGIDAIEVNGRTYEIDGEAQEWPDLSGRADHVEAFLRRVTG